MRFQLFLGGIVMFMPSKPRLNSRGSSVVQL
ncbi:hypothetical protein CJF32_00010773 [Rutstroemia sp. NJR-2017a WRK4]|nr:hypothetical protein CJF32_00010773 [Rutstroemia sp. NJR-2017a WRK4]